MVKIVHAGVVTGPDAIQEQSDRILAIVEPIAQVLLDLPPEDCFNVVGSLLMTYALRFVDPTEAVMQISGNVLSSIPEAIDWDRPKN